MRALYIVARLVVLPRSRSGAVVLSCGECACLRRSHSTLVGVLGLRGLALEAGAGAARPRQGESRPRGTGSRAARRRPARRLSRPRSEARPCRRAIASFLFRRGGCPVGHPRRAVEPVPSTYVPPRGPSYSHVKRMHVRGSRLPGREALFNSPSELSGGLFTEGELYEQHPRSPRSKSAVKLAGAQGQRQTPQGAAVGGGDHMRRRHRSP